MEDTSFAPEKTDIVVKCEEDPSVGNKSVSLILPGCSSVFAKQFKTLTASFTRHALDPKRVDEGFLYKNVVLGVDTDLVVVRNGERKWYRPQKTLFSFRASEAQLRVLKEYFSAR